MRRTKIAIACQGAGSQVGGSWGISDERGNHGLGPSVVALWLQRFAGRSMRNAGLEQLMRILAKGVSMLNKACAGLLVVLFLSTEAVAQDWPPLPTQGFISDRVATHADVAAGNAVFSAGLGGAAGKSTPLRIQIPQYAYYNEGGTNIPVVVLQAERTDIRKPGGEVVQLTFVGVLMPDGKKLVAALPNIKLLGRVAPK
jgi:hypothetical protein